VQKGSAEALFERPTHTFVGHFIGSPGMNFLPATHIGSALEVAGHVMTVPLAADGRAVALPQGALRVGVRPEYLALVEPGAAGSIPAEVVQAQDIGTHLMLTARRGELTLRARLSAYAPEGAGDDAAAPPVPAAGETVWLGVVGPHTCFYVDEELIPSNDASPSAQREGRP
jgi:glycerol transport system ATP-binding protein